MKKFNTEALEKMAKEKNIDKNKIESIANNYKQKSESELMDELVKLGKKLDKKEEVISKLKNFLNEEQRNKLDSIMDKLNESEQSKQSEQTKKKVRKKIRKTSK